MRHEQIDFFFWKNNKKTSIVGTTEKFYTLRSNMRSKSMQGRKKKNTLSLVRRSEAETDQGEEDYFSLELRSLVGLIRIFESLCFVSLYVFFILSQFSGWYWCPPLTLRMAR